MNKERRGRKSFRHTPLAVYTKNRCRLNYQFKNEKITELEYLEELKKNLDEYNRDKKNKSLDEYTKEVEDE